MSTKSKFNFDPLPSVKPEGEATKTTFAVIEKYAPFQEATKVTFSIEHDLKEKMNDFGYWTGQTQQDIILKALDAFLADKDPKPRPQLVKDRKVGRKRKV